MIGGAGTLKVRFGRCVLDLDRLELRNGDNPVSLEPQVFSLLVYLLQNRDRVVSRDEIVDAVWNGRIVSEGTLNTRISGVRRAVGDTGATQQVIKTYPRRGFRFVAEVEKYKGDSGEVEGLGLASVGASIAVLPFINIGGDPVQEYFADGITEDIITELSRFSGLFVIARMSSFAYKGQVRDVRKVARELGVRFLLEGSVRRRNERLRINAQLVDGVGGNQLWTERYDGDLGSVFDFQERIIEEIIAGTALSLTRAEQQRALRAPTDNTNAYDFVLRGTYFHHLYSKADNARAREMFERAIALAPDYGEAFAGLGWTHVHDFNFDWSEDPATSLRLAVEKSERAVALDPASAKAHMVLGDAYLWSGRVDDAYAEGKLAIMLNPNYADGHFLFAWYAAWAGEVEEATASAMKALRLDPRTSFFGYHFTLGHAQFLSGNFVEAVSEMQEAVRREPNVWFVRLWLIAAYGHLGERQRAERHLAEMARLRGLRRNELALDRPLLPRKLKYRKSEHTKLLRTGLWLAGVH